MYILPLSHTLINRITHIYNRNFLSQIKTNTSRHTAHSLFVVPRKNYQKTTFFSSSFQFETLSVFSALSLYTAIRTQYHNNNILCSKIYIILHSWLHFTFIVLYYSKIFNSQLFLFFCKCMKYQIITESSAIISINRKKFFWQNKFLLLF